MNEVAGAYLLGLGAGIGIMLVYKLLLPKEMNEEELYEQLEKYFPKGKSKVRGKALVLIAMARELGVQGAYKKMMEKENE